MKLLDTTVAVDYLRGLPAAFDLLDAFLMEGETIASSEVVRYELLAGVRPDEAPSIERFFSLIDWYVVNEPVVRVAGRLAQQYRRANTGIGLADYLVAATAMILEADVVTSNVRHFPMFEGLRPPY